MKTPHELVMEWHTTYNVPIGSNIGWPRPERCQLRLDLIEEEWGELLAACAASDLIGAVDALGDLTYVIYGMAIEMGVNLDNILDEIQRSNMSKLGEDGQPIYRDDGKVLKGPNYSPPDLASILRNQPRL